MPRTLCCEEGPWLNGTDLAPFPLGFFTAGLVSSYMSEFLTHARRADVEVHGLQVMVDNLYGMEGSLMRGTMGEQTCYLHAACRSAIKTRISLGQ